MNNLLDLTKRLTWVASSCALFSAVLLSVDHFEVRESDRSTKETAHQTSPTRSLSMLENTLQEFARR